MIPGYTRPTTSHFAHRVVRAMTKTCAPHQIGVEGFALVALVGHQWDTVRYSRPVTYRIAHLMNLLAIKSVDGFYRLERRCIAAGWLMKHSPGGRQPPAYWVTIPEHAMEMPDSVTDDHDEVEQGAEPEPKRNDNGTKTGTQTEPIRNRNGTETEPKRNPSTLYPIPDPLPGESAPEQIDPDPLGMIPLAQSPTSPPPRTDEDLWRLEMSPQHWARELRKARCKVGPGSWRSWMALVDQYGIDAVVAAAKSVPAEVRWADRTETALSKSRGQLPIAAALAVSGRKTVVLCE